MKLIVSNDTNRQIEFAGQLRAARTDEKFRHAGKKFGIFFGLAVAAIFIPVLHFVLVPAFLIVAVWMFLRTYQENLRLEVPVPPPCLQCGKPIELPKFIQLGSPIKCGDCSTRYQIRE